MRKISGSPSRAPAASIRLAPSPISSAGSKRNRIRTGKSVPSSTRIDASTNAAPAPDLRKLDRGCRRIAEPALKARCQADNDAYFARTVRQGKVILGVTHMPPWDGVLKQELAWAIQVFVESRAGAGQ